MRRKKPEGYKELLVYKRADELRSFIFNITENFPLSEKRRKEHMRDSARSVKQNIVEGWKRETTKQYVEFLSFSFGSLGELKEDSEDCYKDKLISKQIYDELIRRCGEIDYLMGRLKLALEKKIKDKGQFKNSNSQLEKLLNEYNLIRLPDGRVVEKGKEG
ncbi:MAG: four helix bundle protein [candidate division WOR-3 bacterium]|nr:four helix bundle protein [candidate division WOR-3 bacterium]